MSVKSSRPAVWSFVVLRAIHASQLFASIAGFLVLVASRVVCGSVSTSLRVTDVPFGATTRPLPFEAPRYTVSIMSMSSCLSVMGQLLQASATPLVSRLAVATHILLLLPVPRSIMMCLLR